MTGEAPEGGGNAGGPRLCALHVTGDGRRAWCGSCVARSVQRMEHCAQGTVGMTRGANAERGALRPERGIRGWGAWQSGFHGETRWKNTQWRLKWANQNSNTHQIDYLLASRNA